MLTDGRTDERTNGRKLARLCLPAKAGATKTGYNMNAIRQTAFLLVNPISGSSPLQLHAGVRLQTE